MANICRNRIIASTTDSEWKEISTAFNRDQIDWPASLDGTACNDSYKEISCETKWSPSPWDEGKMAALSRSYPSVMFYYDTEIEDERRSPAAWFCNGEESKEKRVESNRKQAYMSEVRRFVSATSKAADGIDHRVEVMPDGRVAADGENRFGECDIFSWANIKAISCGNWHTVGLREDGTLVACGSNANGQCDVGDVNSRAVAVSCGRYHTAILLENGKVEIRGKLEQEARKNSDREDPPFVAKDFPQTYDLQLSQNMPDLDKMNERIEYISVGDELIIKKHPKADSRFFDVLDIHGGKIGELEVFFTHERLAKTLESIRATVETVTPLSARRKGSKYAQMTIRMDYVFEDERTYTAKKVVTAAGEYTSMNVRGWPTVEGIKSVFDAVIGVTEDGEIYVDGFCPSLETEIDKIVDSASNRQHQ